MIQVWSFITDFGDSVVTLALSVVVLGYLLTLRRHRAACSWALAVGGCGLATIFLKIALRACSPPDLAAGVASPSGHAAASATVYWSLATVVAQEMRRDGRLLAWILAALATTAIAVSRIALGAHTPAEVLVGLVVGSFFAWLFTRCLRSEAGPHPHAYWALGLAAITVAVLHGGRWPIEESLRRVADLLRATLPACAALK